MKQRIPTYMITGFLGSGKTTILQKILNYCKQHHLTPALVINEIGETNVEADLFSEDHMLQLLDGCICCSIQSDFTNELHHFLTQLPSNELPDLIMIESTGIANPIEIINSLTEPHIIELLDLHSVISLVDGSKYLEYRSIFSSSKEVREVLKAQIVASSLIIINKLDLMSEKAIKNVRKKVGELKRNTTSVMESSYGGVAVEQLLEKRLAFTEKSEQAHCNCNAEECCSNHHHNHSIQVLKISVNAPLNQAHFERWLKKLPATIVRGKGIVQLAGKAGIFQFQYASKQLHFTQIAKETAISPCLIFIGLDINSEELEASFSESFYI